MGVLVSKRHVEGASLAYDSDGLYKLEFDTGENEGLKVWIVRHEENGQLAIYINTEDMDTDHEDGTPIMNVLLNNATLYDKEPS